MIWGSPHFRKLLSGDSGKNGYRIYRYPVFGKLLVARWAASRNGSSYCRTASQDDWSVSVEYSFQAGLEIQRSLQLPSTTAHRLILEFRAQGCSRVSLGLCSHKHVRFLPSLPCVQPHFRPHAFGIRPCHCAKWKDMEHAVILHMSTQESPSSCF